MYNNPNIVFILTDDMGYGDASCYGATKINTPNIDKLAREGMQFMDAHSSSAVCTPSRYSVLTGRYCWRSRLKRGVLSGHGPALIEPGRMTVAGMLKQNGYVTGAFGKWHLGLNWVKKDSSKEPARINDFNKNENPEDYDYSKPLTGGPLDHGFDYFYGISGSLDMPPYCYIENDHTVGIPDREKSPYMFQQRRGYMVEGWKDDEVDLKFTEKAIEFIKSNVKSTPGRPFFAYIPFAAPHRPCVPPDFIKGKSQAGLRGDMVALVDWCVGKITNTLDELGITENTLIIFTSDNGARACDIDGNMYGHRSCGDWRGYKSDIWEGGHRVPFVAKWPKAVRAGIKTYETVSLMDFMATCAEITGVDLPSDAGEDSFSLMPVFSQAGESLPVRDCLVHHSLNGMFSIRKENWKFIDGIGSGGFATRPDGCLVKNPIAASEGIKGQLYDMANDPWEVSNLYAKESKVADELMETLSNIKEKGTSKFKER